MFIWQNGKIQATNYKMEGEFRHSFVCISLLQTIEVNNQTRKGNDVSIKNNALTGTKTYAARSRLLISPLHLKLTVRNLLHAFGAIWYVNHFPTKKCIRCHNHINISWYHAGKYLHFKKQKLCRMLQVKWTAFNHTTSVKLYTGKNPKKSPYLSQKVTGVILWKKITSIKPKSSKYSENRKLNEEKTELFFCLLFDNYFQEIKSQKIYKKE